MCDTFCGCADDVFKNFLYTLNLKKIHLWISNSKISIGWGLLLIASCSSTKSNDNFTGKYKQPQIMNYRKINFRWFCCNFFFVENSIVLAFCRIVQFTYLFTNACYPFLAQAADKNSPGRRLSSTFFFNHSNNYFPRMIQHCFRPTVGTATKILCLVFNWFFLSSLLFS